MCGAPQSKSSEKDNHLLGGKEWFPFWHGLNPITQSLSIVKRVEEHKLQSAICMEIKKKIQLTYKGHSSAKDLENSEREQTSPRYISTKLPLHLPTLQQQGKEQ